jgi:hypothetical protein
MAEEAIPQAAPVGVVQFEMENDANAGSADGKGVNNLAAHFEKAAPQDVTETFLYLREIQAELFNIINTELSIREDLRCSDLHAITGLDGTPAGSIRTFTGQDSPIDWGIYAYVGQPKNGFTNLHLTFYVDPSIDVPHLGLALGTSPEIFYYLDLTPRVDFWNTEGPAYFLKYLSSMNQASLDVRRDASTGYFNSASPLIRAGCGPLHMCGLCPLAVFREKVLPHFYTYVRTWVQMVKAAKKVSLQYSAKLER